MVSADEAIAGKTGPSSVPKEPHYATVRVLWLLATLGIIYGSLYPFAFEARNLALPEAVTTLLANWQDKLSPINVLMNGLLFVPYGLFAVLSLATLRPLSRWLVVIFTAALVAFGVQVIQLWLPGRVPTAADGLVNMAGTAAGAVMALIPGVRSLMVEPGRSAGQLRALPLLLMLCWLAYRWFPFVPSLDVATVKDGLRPLMEPELRPLDLLHNLAGWVVFAFLWVQCGLRPVWLGVVIPLAVLAEAGIADNALTMHNLLAAAAAPLVWALIGRFAQRPVEPVTVLLIAVVLLQGARPFELGSTAFSWFPFEGFLGGSMFVNLSSLLEKSFLYGSLVWLVLEASQSRLTGVLLPLLIVGGLEALQTQVATRSPEITDALLVFLLWGVALVAWRPRSVRAHRTAGAGYLGVRRTAST